MLFKHSATYVIDSTPLRLELLARDGAIGPGGGYATRMIVWKGKEKMKEYGICGESDSETCSCCMTLARCILSYVEFREESEGGVLEALYVQVLKLVREFIH